MTLKTRGVIYPKQLGVMSHAAILFFRMGAPPPPKLSRSGRLAGHRGELPGGGSPVCGERLGKQPMTKRSQRTPGVQWRPLFSPFFLVAATAPLCFFPKKGSRFFSRVTTERRFCQNRGTRFGWLAWEKDT